MIWNTFIQIIFPATKQTLYMVLVSTFFAVLLSILPAIILVITSPKGLKPNKVIYSILDFTINILRSFPFLILMISIIPLTRFIVGTPIGTDAALVPLSIGASPFATRIIESALMEVDYGIIEAAKAFGLTDFQIIFKVMLTEALPSIVHGITLTVISIVGYSAMAATIGGEGLGAVAINYGYNRFETDIMLYTIAMLIIIVQIFQFIGNSLYKFLTK